MKPGHNPWTDEDVAKLRRLVSTSPFADEIFAAFPDRTRKAIQNKCDWLNLRLPVRRSHWREDEDKILTDIVQNGGSIHDATAALPRRSSRSIIGRASRIGLTWCGPKRPKNTGFIRKARKPRKPMTASFDSNPLDRKKPQKLPKIFCEPVPGVTKDLMELRLDDCRWVYDTDEGYRYCAKPKQIGAFCDYHGRAAYRSGA